MNVFFYIILLSTGIEFTTMLRCCDEQFKMRNYFNCISRKPPVDECDKKGCVALDDIEYKDATPFIPPVTGGKVIKVYDGDTITIASRLPIINSPVYRFSVRLSGIDSAEIKGKSFAEKEEAIKARDALRSLIMGKIVTLSGVSTEKYGRILATVHLGDINVCEWMLQHKYAVPYDGGTKNRPKEWED
jgi:endonuclease YncB( thermonuclease family)